MTPLRYEYRALKAMAVLVVAYWIVIGLVACHATPNITTPQGQRALKADEVVLRLSELQNATIAAKDNGTLSTETAMKIVTYCMAAAESLRSAPEGWEAVAKQGWKEFRATLPPITNTGVILGLAALDGLLGAL